MLAKGMIILLNFFPTNQEILDKSKHENLARIKRDYFLLESAHLKRLPKLKAKICMQNYFLPSMQY